jgi:hypothetical protein
MDGAPPGRSLSARGLDEGPGAQIRGIAVSNADAMTRPGTTAMASAHMASFDAPRG